MSIVNVVDFGVKGDGVALDSGAIQAAIDHVAAVGGGTVVVPGGHAFRCAGILLKSHVNLHLESGSVLQASSEEADYAPGQFNCVLEADQATDVSITGLGRIDGCGSTFIKEDLGYIYDATDWRPGLICFRDCQQVTLRDFSLIESAWWTVHLIACRDVLIDGLRIANDLKMPNCDGIDPDHCQNVRISNCSIRCADDCIVFKNTADYLDRGPCRDITVTNCTLMCTATALKIGSESAGDFENITITGCTIKSSSRGFGIQLRDQGNVRNVVFANSTIETRLFDDHYWGKAEPVHISVSRRFRRDATELPDWNPENRLGSVWGIIFSNLICQSENGIVIYGEKTGGEDFGVEDVLLQNIQLNIRKWTKWPGGEFDLRPHGGPLGGVMRGIKEGKTDPGVVARDFSGVLVENARGVTLSEVTVHWGAELPDYYRHALEAVNSPLLELDSFRAGSPHPGRSEAISICQSATQCRSDSDSPHAFPLGGSKMLFRK